MRRRDRRRFERFRRTAAVVASSFALGALTDAALTWRLDESRRETDEARAGAAADPAPAHDPAEPRGVERPGDDGGAAAGTAGAVTTTPQAVALLRGRKLDMPVHGVARDALRDTFADGRGSRLHEAIDIMAPRHTPVVAVEDGTIARLFTSAGGGVTIYQFEPSGLFTYFYAHLDRYADGLREGQSVERGQVIGYVGSTGNASPDAPHLHFAIFRQTPERQWWTGEPVNPYPVLR